MSQNFALVWEMTLVFFYGYFFQPKIDQKKLNQRGITAESPAYVEILTLIQKFLHHFKA